MKHRSAQQRFTLLGYTLVVLGMVWLTYAAIAAGDNGRVMREFESEQSLMAAMRHHDTRLTMEMLLLAQDASGSYRRLEALQSLLRQDMARLTALERHEGEDDDAAVPEGVADLLKLLRHKLRLLARFAEQDRQLSHTFTVLRQQEQKITPLLPEHYVMNAANLRAHLRAYSVFPSPALRASVLRIRDEFNYFNRGSEVDSKLQPFLGMTDAILSRSDQQQRLRQRILDIGIEDQMDRVIARELAIHRDRVAASNRKQIVMALFGILFLLVIAWGIRRIDRNQRELATANDELKYQRMAIDQHSILAVTDRAGTIIEVNDKFCQISGYTRAELIGQNHRILKSGVHPDSFYADLWATIAAGKVWKGEVCNRRKDGALYWVESTVIPVANEEGVIQRYIAIRTDITARKKAEQARMESEQCTRQVMESAVDAIVIADAEGNILQWNPAASAMFGYTREEMENGGNIDCLIDTKLVSSGKILSRNIEIEVPCADGGTIPVEMSMNMLKRGEQTHYSLFFHDIRAQKAAAEAMAKAAEEARKAVESKSMFLSTVSHELRTPLNGVIGMSDLLMDTQLTEEQVEFASTIRASSEALLTIINDILDFSKIEAGRMDIEEVDFDLRSVVEGSAVVVSHKVGNKPVALLPFIDPAIPPTLKGDPTRLRQIMLNLIDNAMKFTSEGHVVARAELLEFSDRGARVRFSVEDTGIGLSEEAQAKLFQPFVQADGSTTRKFGGTGLGLAICRRLVQLMGGEITLQSKEGEGSTFSFTLDLPVGEAPADVKVSEDTLRKLEDVRLLLVDDDGVARDVLSRYIRSWNMTVEAFESGEAALAHIESCLAQGTRPNLLLVDLRMPQMDGFELADRVRALDRELPMVLCTAHGSMGLKHQAKEHGFDRLLTKPVRMSQLLDAIVSVLGMQAAREQPLAVDVEDDAEQHAPLSVAEAAAAGRLVLLVEDNPVNQRVAQMHLHKLGYTCHTVNDGCEALQASECTPYSIILMDCQMPVMDGFEATRAIRKREAEQGEPHRIIIAMTANAMTGDRDRCLEAGMDDYLSKPISRDRLQEVLARWHDEASPVAMAEEGSDTDTAEEDGYIDLAYVRELVGDDDAIVRELLQLFYDSMRDVVRDKMAVALENRDSSAMKAHAHELKGASGNIGATAIGERCRQIEQWAEAEAWPQIIDAVEWLKAAHRAIGDLAGGGAS